MTFPHTLLSGVSTAEKHIVFTRLFEFSINFKSKAMGLFLQEGSFKPKAMGLLATGMRKASGFTAFCDFLSERVLGFDVFKLKATGLLAPTRGAGL